MLLSLALAPRTDSFQLHGAFSGVSAAAKETRLSCSQSLASCSFVLGRVAEMSAGMRAATVRSADAAVLRAGAADFVLESFDPEEEVDELSNENLLKVLYSETTDQHVNDLVWAALGETFCMHFQAQAHQLVAYTHIKKRAICNSCIHACYV
jgi:hypothetical protein